MPYSRDLFYKIPSPRLNAYLIKMQSSTTKKINNSIINFYIIDLLTSSNPCITKCKYMYINMISLAKLYNNTAHNSFKHLIQKYVHGKDHVKPNKPFH